MKTLPLILCAAALGGGIAAMLAWGVFPPPWLAGLEAALLAGAALLYGFTAYLPTLPHWLWLRPIRGTVLVIVGIGAMYVPPQLILSAYLIGVGVRLVWQSACDLAEPETPSRAGSRPPERKVPCTPSASCSTSSSPLPSAPRRDITPAATGTGRIVRS